MAIQVIQPILIVLLLDYFQGHDVTTAMAYVYGTLLAGSGAASASLLAVLSHQACMVGMRLRAATSALIYQKVNSQF